ncbi:MAG: zinc ribbon domain-containing protein [Lachnospiraceae bacterium]|nr:zinc ribbon domain-containing protein [Lachnospiraceae bacterium]
MFCINCGTRLADDAVFCVNCGCKITAESVGKPEVQQSVVTEQPVTMEPVVMEQPVAEQPVFQQDAYNQGQYSSHGAFQTTQQMYQPQQPVAQQAFYNTPAQPVKKSNASVPAIIFLVIAAIASIAISIGHFVDGEIGMGVMNLCYFATSIVLIVYSVSTKKIGSILKGVFFLLMLVLNVIFAGVSAFGAAFDIFGNAKAGIDYYYAIIILLQYIFLYVYMLVSIIRSFIGKEKVSYATCLFGYFAMILIIAAFVVDVASDINGLFIFNFIPVDLGIVTLIIGDIFAATRKGKKVSE